MTTVRILKSQEGMVFGFISSGHASGKRQSGGDIYCAGISAITQTACIGLEEVAGVKTKRVISDGYLSVTVPLDSAATVPCRTIFDTLVLGLISLKRSYPGHLQIIEEVQ